MTSINNIDKHLWVVWSERALNGGFAKPRFPLKRFLLAPLRTKRLGYALKSGRGWLELGCSFEGTNHFVKLPQLLQDHAAILPGGGIVGFQRQNALAAGERVVIPSKHEECVPACIPDPRPVVL